MLVMGVIVTKEQHQLVYNHCKKIGMQSFLTMIFLNICCRTLLEKQSPSGDLILNVGVGKGGVKVTFSTLTGLQYAVLLNSLEIEVWTHLAITVC